MYSLKPHSRVAVFLYSLALSAVVLSQQVCFGADQQSRRETTPDQLLARYATFRLTADLSALSARERAMIPLLINAAKAMDEAFWIQAYGDKQSLLSGLNDTRLRRYAELNYGPWDRLDDNRPFVPGVGPKPRGANFYPVDMTKERFDAYVTKHPKEAPALRSLFTMVRHDAGGGLRAIPYHEFFVAQVQRAARKLREAAALADDAGLKKYLTLRAAALLDDNYRDSDRAWLDMKTNTIDVVIGPIETYEDQLFGTKASYEAYVLIKDKTWSARLAKYAALLPGLQRGLPVADKYKQESPGTDSDLNAYDVVYYAGDCNAGSKTIAINLPNDETVQLEKGTRRVQLKNAMRAKFDKILVPIAGELIAADQRRHITFDAFFGNTMFHEVAHGLGIKNTITGRGTVREALQAYSSALEEGKADILGLYMVTELFAQGVLPDRGTSAERETRSRLSNRPRKGAGAKPQAKDKPSARAVVMDNYVTFLASIFRSVRFGASSAHGRANMVRFNYFKKKGAFTRDASTGTYRVNFDKMKEAMTALSREILTLQGDGDVDGVKALMDEYGHVGSTLQADLDRLSNAGIPVDIVFEQGMDVLE